MQSVPKDQVFPWSNVGVSHCYDSNFLSPCIPGGYHRRKRPSYIGIRWVSRGDPVGLSAATTFCTANLEKQNFGDPQLADTVQCSICFALRLADAGLSGLRDEFRGRFQWRHVLAKKSGAPDDFSESAKTPPEIKTTPGHAILC